MKNIFSFILMLIIISSFVTNPVMADSLDNLKSRVEKAKINLIVGNETESFSELITLDYLTQEPQYQQPLYKSIKADILYNLALAYYQTYYFNFAKDKTYAKIAYLIRSDSLFKQAYPDINEAILSMQKEKKSKQPKVNHQNGYVAQLLKHKAKEWLKNPENCNFDLSKNELDIATNLFINLTNKEDIPQLTELSHSNAKIREIFSRTEKYYDLFNYNNPIKKLYVEKLQDNCKINYQ